MSHDDGASYRARFTRTREQTLISRKLKREASETEKKLWPRLVRDQMGAPFRRQYRKTAGHADYCCVPLNLMIEIDGPTHDAARDAIRDYRMAHDGFDVLRFSVQEIDRNLEGVVSTIYDAVQLRLMARRHR
jgi:very-short-patch-repair endonuclease